MIRLIKTFHFQTPRNRVAVGQSDWSLLYLLVLSSFLCQMRQTAETSFAPQSSSGVPQVYVLSPLTLLYIRHSILSLEMNPAHTEDTAAEGCFQQPQMPLYTIPLTDEHTFSSCCVVFVVWEPQPAQLIFVFHMQRTDHRHCLTHHRRLLDHFTCLTMC